VASEQRTQIAQISQIDADWLRLRGKAIRQVRTDAAACLAVPSIPRIFVNSGETTAIRCSSGFHAIGANLRCACQHASVISAISVSCS